MKKLLTVLIMVLAFNLSNAQYYLEAGTNLHPTLTEGLPATYQAGFGFEAKGIDTNLFYQGYFDIKVNTIGLGVSKVWYSTSKASGISLGAIIGSDFYKGGNDYFYSPDFSARMYFTDKFGVIFQVTVPQYNINEGYSEWNKDFYLNLKLRLKV